MPDTILLFSVEDKYAGVNAHPGPSAFYLVNKENRFVLMFPRLAKRSRSD
jgi:hypothetical protein